MNRTQTIFALTALTLHAFAPFLRAEETSFNYGFDDIADSLVSITYQEQNEPRHACGFIAKMDGNHYIFTNQHILLGAEGLSFKTATGKTLRPRKVELAMSRDLVRLEIEDRTALNIGTHIEMGMPVAVCGKNGAKDSTTELHGTINGVGSDLIEISAEFEPENSGSPILNTEREVIGIASHVRKSRSHRMKEGTKFEDLVRRFCYRLEGTTWQAVNWKRYNGEFGEKYREGENLTSSVFDIIIGWNDGPLDDVKLDIRPEKSLATWMDSHNAIMHRYGRSTDNRQLLDQYSSSLKTLAEVCRSRSRQAAMYAEQRGLTTFLKTELDQQSQALDFAADVLIRRSDLIYSYRN